MKEISDQLKTNGFSGNFHKDASATFKYIFQNERKLIELKILIFIKYQLDGKIGCF